MSSLTTPRSQDGFSKPTIIGFALPFVLAILIGLVLHHHSAPKSPTISADARWSPAENSSVSAGSLPSADEVSAANAAILDYCRSDLRQGTSCSLVSNSDTTAPGFVESGIHQTGQFASDGASGEGLALAKGSGSSWSVIWVGQDCVPKNVATQNNVPSSIKTCAS